MTSPVAIAAEDPGGAEALAFLDAGEALMASLYPAQSNHMLDLASLRDPQVRFLVARDAAGKAVGCGAFRREAGWVEVKRMWVDPASRGLGVGGALLARIEALAAAEGFALARLETGVRNPDAVALYRRAGWSECPPFAPYGPDPNSVFMEKRLHR